MKTEKTKFNLPLIDADLFQLDPTRYTLKRGSEDGAPLCPFGNEYEWIGFDQQKERYVRFTKSVFRRLIQLLDKSEKEH